MKYKNIPEEEIKNKVTRDFFQKFDCTRILGKIDFAVKLPNEEVYLLWAEAKQKPSNILVMLAQLVLTVGKARTFDEILPPLFLGCYDSEKIVFVPYSEIQDVFYQNDFNWNVAPSNHETKEFKQVYSQIEKIINSNIPWETYLFYFEKDEQELRRFIHENFIVGKSDATKIKIDKNNFIIVYNKWFETVKPTIAADWDAIRRSGLIDGDFYLADLLSDENQTIVEKLFVLLRSNHYIANRYINDVGLFTKSSVYFKDGQKAHSRFWAKYERPPHGDYWNYIIDRHDLLVPQDIRERRGSFYTPRIWVEKSQEYLAKVLGKDWQDEYYIWDCCAGTGNLLAGLTNKYNIWASTLDKSDVDIMKQRIENGANLLENHVFQFDFLNDGFDKLPVELQRIINNEQLRKKIVIFINPPYAETAINKTHNKDRINKRGVSFTGMREKYAQQIGIATKELCAQFLARIYDQLQGAVLAQFSTLKIVHGPNFSKFRNFFKAEFQKGFVVPANTFDNVTGNFPIGFMIWKLDGEKPVGNIKLDVFDKDGNNVGGKTFYAYGENIFITDWFKKYHTRIEDGKNIGAIGLYGSDFQHNNFIRITNNVPHPNRWTYIAVDNLIEACVYLAVRHCIEDDWLNNRDQFLYPSDRWQTDRDFQNDCLIYALFHPKNKISSKNAVNHWTPFTEEQVNAQKIFESHFMSSFINGKIKSNGYTDLFTCNAEKYCIKREFSSEAQAVFDAGKDLWRYYHAQKNINVNAALYDIKEYFQGRKDNGKMNNKSEDEHYNGLIGNLRENLKALAAKIEPKVYEYEFLN